MNPFWIVVGPYNFVSRSAASEAEAWEHFAHTQRWALASEKFIQSAKGQGFRSIKVVEVDELRERVEGLEWASRRSSDNIDRSAVLDLLDSIIPSPIEQNFGHDLVKEHLDMVRRDLPNFECIVFPELPEDDTK